MKIVKTDTGYGIEIAEGETYRKSFETACWYETLALEPGTYPLHPTAIHGGAPFEGQNPYYYTAYVPGVITDAYFPIGFGGLYTYSPEKEARDKEKIGRSATAHYTFYAYQIEKGDLY